MTATITIDRRFRGPANSGNGGVSAGLVAGLLGGRATVRLRRPPPLETPLSVTRSEDTVEVTSDGEVVLSATPPVVAPGPPAVDAGDLRAIFGRGPGRPLEDHRAPDCYVCSTVRTDGLRITPERVPGTDLYATVWVPDADTADETGVVAAPIVWGALDCPAGFAVIGDEMTFFPALTSFTVDIAEPVLVGHEVAVIGWPVSGDDRRVDGGTAIVARDGRVLATAYASHARLPLDFALG